MTGSLFRFVQFEFPWELGPPDGRYVVRGHAAEVEHVVITQTLGAPERRGVVRNRRAREVDPEPPPNACGDGLCPEGTVCCNESCGICTPPGGACTQQVCD